MSENTVTISIARFKSLEESESILWKNLNSPDKFIRIHYYSGVYDYFVTDDANKALNETLAYYKKKNDSLELEVKNLKSRPIKTFFKNLFTKNKPKWKN